MNRPTDEVLVAYADGKLSAAEAEAVEHYLARDDETRRFVAALTRSAELTRQAFDEPMREPTSKSLADMIMAAPPHPAQRDNVLPMPPRVDRGASWRLDRSALKPMALAASAALLVGLALGSLFANRSGTSHNGILVLGPIAIASDLHEVLERRPTGEAVHLRSERGSAKQRLALAATFRDRLERPCREIEIVTGTSDARPLAAGVACRANDGRWIMEGATRIAANDAGTGDGTYYPSGIREKDALDGLLNMLGAGKSLTVAEERELIAAGWKKK